MTGAQLQSGRERKGWNQKQAAVRLGVSQPYLSLLERGDRRVPELLARRATSVYGLSASALPVETPWDVIVPVDEEALALDLAALGYPGLAHLRRRRRKKNPAEVLLAALGAGDLDARLIEALPWIPATFPDLDWERLIVAAKVRDLQNRLGFIIAVARRLAEIEGDADKARLLGRRATDLERSRLAREDTLCHDSLTQAERRWLRKHRPAEARRWRLLTDLSVEHLGYAAPTSP